MRALKIIAWTVAIACLVHLVVVVERLLARGAL